MTLTADSGSTKTAWFCDGLTFETQGLNPLTTPDADIAATLEQVAGRLGGRPVDRVVFYGAGCATEPMRRKVAQHLGEVFPQAVTEVGTDMLGACRGFGDASCEGLVGILGTGSNACYYDGKAIVFGHRSLGYILGDEGSGNHIGRCLLKDCLEMRMPRTLATLFSDQYGITPPAAIECLYGKPNAGRWLASLAPFASDNIGDPYIANLVEQCMESYFYHIVEPLRKMAQDGGYGHSDQLRMVGGIANAFAGQLRAVAARHQIEIMAIQSAPKY